ncbi:MAG: glycosyltransferase family 2 protein [Aureliella sp.]
MNEMNESISALIVVTDRYDDVVECLSSLIRIEHLLAEVCLLVNAPSNDWPSDPFNELPQPVAHKLRITHSETRVFPTEGRNRLAENAIGEFFLFLDDDSKVLNEAGIVKGLKLLRRYDKIGSIAYPQCTDDGVITSSMQPAPVDYICVTAGFVSCGAIVKARVFRKLNGFQEILQMAHEENEFCKRQWNAGYAVCFLPETCISHCPSAVARNSIQRLKLNARNSLYQAILHEPLYLLGLTIVPRLVNAALYLRNECRTLKCSWFDLFLEAMSDFKRDFGQLIVRRSPLRWGSIRLWQKLKASYPPLDSWTSLAGD